MVDVLTGSVNTFLVHLGAGTLAFKAGLLFASVKLLLVFLFVGPRFVYVWHGVSLNFVKFVNGDVYTFFYVFSIASVVSSAVTWLVFVG